MHGLSEAFKLNGTRLCRGFEASQTCHTKIYKSGHYSTFRPAPPHSPCAMVLVRKDVRAVMLVTSCRDGKGNEDEWEGETWQGKNFPSC